MSGSFNDLKSSVVVLYHLIWIQAKLFTITHNSLHHQAPWYICGLMPYPSPFAPSVPATIASLLYLQGQTQFPDHWTCDSICLQCTPQMACLQFCKTSFMAAVDKIMVPQICPCPSCWNLWICYLTWQKGPCRCHYIKLLEIGRLSCIIRMGLIQSQGSW